LQRVAPSSFCFGSFELDLKAEVLRESGVPVRLPPQAFKLLALLVSRHGELVSREDIQKELWQGETFVDFQQGVNKLIRQIRVALSDDADIPAYIETVPRRGYRFAGKLRPDASPLQEETLDPSPTAAPPADDGSPCPPRQSVPLTETAAALPQPRRQVRWIAAVAGVLVLAAIGSALVSRHSALALWNRWTGPQIHALAVLPLENLSGDSGQDYLADGMTDELITDLSKIASLRVPSRTSIMRYKGTHKTLEEISRELHVDAVVEGSVSRTGEQIRIRTQLINPAKDEHLWAASYTSNVRDVPRVQAEMVEEIAGQIRVRLTSQERGAIARSLPPSVPEAYEAYLKGRYFFNQFTLEGLKKSCTYFEESTKADPSYSLGYLGLADCYVVQSQMGLMSANEVIPKARAMAKKALEIDDTLANAHSTLGTILLHYDWDWPAAYRELQRAVELDPNSADPHSRLSIYYQVMGKIDDAVRESKFAQRLDPTSEKVCIALGWFYVDAGRYDDAAGELPQCLDLNPDSVYVHFGLYHVYDQKKMYAQAMAELQETTKGGYGNEVAGNLEKTYRKSGYDEARKYFFEAQLKGDLEFKADPLFLAVDYAEVGDKEKALDCLELAYKQRSTSLTQLKVNSSLDTVREEPRFQKILKDMRLAD
jgi:TolB-like protein/DNA-binding winged helix-turn-helix (wHTH) protein/tetratricopeptide (TPR) repeat protein